MARSRTAIKYVIMVKYDAVFHSPESSGGLVLIEHSANYLIPYLTAPHFTEIENISGNWFLFIPPTDIRKALFF